MAWRKRLRKGGSQYLRITGEELLPACVHSHVAESRPSFPRRRTPCLYISVLGKRQLPYAWEACRDKELWYAVYYGGP